jgi:hypothetical protein
LIEGVITNKINNAPVKRAHVIYTKVASSHAEASSPVSSDTDNDGRFSIPLEPGSYRLWVERPGFSQQMYGAQTAEGEGSILTVAPGDHLQNLDMSIVPLGAIAGRVLDDDGEPLLGVGIQVLKFSYATGMRQLVPVGGASSNDRGEYRAFGLPAGHYYLLASRRGAPISHPIEKGALVPEVLDRYAALYYPGVLDLNSASEITLPPGGDLGDIDFRLQRIRAATVRGHLASPVEDFGESQVQVVLAHNDGNIASSIDRATATLDKASGRFEFHGIAPGNYLLIASQLYRGHSLAGRVPVEVTAAGNVENVTVPLVSAFDLTGTVEFEGGSAARYANVSVGLNPLESLSLGRPPASKVGSDGSIRLAGVTPGEWEIALDALPEGYWLKAATYGDADVSGGELRASDAPRGPVHIVLAANGAQIAGKVAEDGKPRKATVVLAPAADELRKASHLFHAATTQNDGTFLFKGVSPGSYKLFALEEVQPFAWLDPELLKPVESSGEPISVAAGDKITRQLAPIPAEALSPH